MFLACDIGNSRIKTALFSGNRITELNTFNSVGQLVSIYTGRNISSTGISSVVPERSGHLIRILNERSFSYHLISVTSRFNLKINYKTPDTLGTDRICSAEGAFLLNGDMKENEIILSIDFGTATTINFVKYPGEFIGGIIAPGINMMGEALHSYTAQLPEFDFTDFDGFIGTSTKSSIASGLINSTTGLIERILNFVTRTYKPKDIKIYLTGGSAENIMPFLDFEFNYEKDLVLYGIKAVADLNL